MKYLITVLLSAAFVLLAVPTTPALTKTVVHNVAIAKPTVHTVTAAKTVQPQPEIKEAATTPVVIQPQPVAQGCEAYRSTFAQYGWSVGTAIAICEAESGGNTSALSATGDRGLMQINYVHADMVGGDLTALYNPYTNISVAYRVYLSQGWYGWSTYKSGAYLRYLQ